MIGLYQLPLQDLRIESGLTASALSNALQVLHRLKFATYDLQTQHVWVREMAKFRLGLHRRTPLAPEDNKVQGAQKLYDKLAANPFLDAFFDRYGKEVRLQRRRSCGSLKVNHYILGLPNHYISGLPKPPKPKRKGLRKPVNRSTGTGTGNRDQKAVQSRDQDQGTAIRNRKITGACAPACSPAKNQTQKPSVETSTDAQHADSSAAVMAASVPNCEGADRRRHNDRQRGMERADQVSARPIGFRVPVAGTFNSGDGGGGARAREAGRATSPTGEAGTTVDAEPVFASQSGGGENPLREPASAVSANAVGQASAGLEHVQPESRTSSGTNVATRADQRLSTGDRAAPEAHLHAAGMDLLRQTFAEIASRPRLAPRRGLRGVK